MARPKLRSMLALGAVVPLLAAGPLGCGGDDENEESLPASPPAASEPTGDDIRGPDARGTVPYGSEDEPTPGTQPPE